MILDKAFKFQSLHFPIIHPRIIVGPTSQGCQEIRLAHLGRASSQYAKVVVRSPVRAHTGSNPWMHKQVEQQINVSPSLSFFLSHQLKRKKDKNPLCYFGYFPRGPDTTRLRGEWGLRGHVFSPDSDTSQLDNLGQFTYFCEQLSLFVMVSFVGQLGWAMIPTYSIKQ